MEEEILEIIQRLKLLTDEQRLEIFAEFCLGCGGDNPCYCQRDD